MTTNHIISDMATRIRNAIQVRQSSVTIPNTRLTSSIAHILFTEGFVDTVIPLASSDGADNKFLLLKLKYTGKSGSLTHIQSISKPGVRIYSRANDLPKVLGGLGIIILSTSKGIITDKKARAIGVGGELLCSIW
jgi:small subunit ribosomal protein S8